MDSHRDKWKGKRLILSYNLITFWPFRHRHQDMLYQKSISVLLLDFPIILSDKICLFQQLLNVKRTSIKIGFPSVSRNILKKHIKVATERMYIGVIHILSFIRTLTDNTENHFHVPSSYFSICIRLQSYVWKEQYLFLPFIYKNL